MLGAVGLIAFVVMHGITVPSGHHASVMSTGVHGDTTNADTTNGHATNASGQMTSAAPKTDAAHEAPGPEHGDVAQACLAAILSALVVVAALRTVTRRPVPRQRRLRTTFGAPEPPVPRFAIAR